MINSLGVSAQFIGAGNLSCGDDCACPSYLLSHLFMTTMMMMMITLCCGGWF